MLSRLGEQAIGEHLMKCVKNVCREGVFNADLGGISSTQDVVHAICAEIGRQGHVNIR